MPRDNKRLRAAQEAKDDEWYTHEDSIHGALDTLGAQLKGKRVLCNADDHRKSEIVGALRNRFRELGLAHLTATGLNAYRYDYDGRDESLRVIESGDFRSPECIDALRACDIVITNPPFSLWREFLATLIEHGNEFLIAAPLGSLKYRVTTPHILSRRAKPVPWKHLWFRRPGKPDANLKHVYWLTSLEWSGPGLELTENYDPERYPRFDDYEAINVDRAAKAPRDYYGQMGLPISYLLKHNPEQFDLIDIAHEPKVRGRRTFGRVIVKRRRNA